MKVLAADDEAGVRNLLKHFLEQYPSPYISYDILDNGMDLRNTCMHQNVDVVFTDIRMPDLSGLEAVYEIKQAIPENTVSFYVISGYDEFEYARQALRLGIKDYILKPVKYATIENILRREEKERFLGLSLQTAWNLNDEEKALELSEMIQNIAANFREHDMTYTEDTEKWFRLSNGIPIDKEYFHSIFGVNKDTFEEQKAFLEEGTKNSSDSSYAKSLIRKICRRIESDCSNPALGLDSIADEIGYSTQYLSTLFKKEAGMHFSAYLTKIRLEKAEKLLLTTNMKIKDIAESCGYSYTSYFIKVFRRQTGLSPAEWKDKAI